MHVNQAFTLNDILRAAHAMTQFDLSKLNSVILIAMVTTVSVPLTTPKSDFTCKFSANEKKDRNEKTTAANVLHQGVNGHVEISQHAVQR